jgi:hypothetical protein
MNHLLLNSINMNKKFISLVSLLFHSKMISPSWSVICEQTLEEESVVTLYQFISNFQVNLYSSSIISTLMIQWILTGETAWLSTNNPNNQIIKVIFFSQEGTILHSCIWVNGFLYHSSLDKFNLRREKFPVNPVVYQKSNNGLYNLWVTILYQGKHPPSYNGETIGFFSPLRNDNVDEVVNRINFLEN